MVLLILSNIIWSKLYTKKDFDKFDQSIEANYGNWFKNCTNHGPMPGLSFQEREDNSGFLAYQESIVIRAYLKMYHATKDTKYLNKFIDHVSSILKHRNDINNIKHKDFFRDRILKGWIVMGRYSPYVNKGEQPREYNYIVHNALIVYPFLAFADIVYTNKLKNYKDIADEFFKLAEETINEFNNDWNGECYIYAYTNKDKYPSAFNNYRVKLEVSQETPMGACFILLYKYTGNLDYFEKARKIAKRFKKTLVLSKNGSYIWYKREEKLPKYLQDLSHTTSDLLFVLSGYKNNLFFTKKDLEKFATTFTKNVIPSDFLTNGFEVNSYVDGSNGSLDSLNKKPFNEYLECTLNNWFDLCEFNKRIYSLEQRILESKSMQRAINGYCNDLDAFYLIGLANLIYYGKKINIPLLLNLYLINTYLKVMYGSIDYIYFHIGCEINSVKFY